jgi:serine protease AprX
MSVKIIELFSIIFLMTCISHAEPSIVSHPSDDALRWFNSEYSTFFSPGGSDDAGPVIYGTSVTPSALLRGEPRVEINAFVYDRSGVALVYAEVGNRMNLMLDLDRDNRYTGYSGSNLPTGSYRVSIVAVDKAGNPSREEASNLTILDPEDLNCNHIEDSLEKTSAQEDLRVIVLHDSNTTSPSLGKMQEKFKVLSGSSMVVPSSKLSELSKVKGVKGIYKDQKLKVMDAGPLPSGGRLPSRAPDDPRSDHEGLDGSGVTVALLDTGADAKHESLESTSRVVAFKDFVSDQETPYDDNGHGTHCASLIAGSGKYRGVAPGSKLVVVKVMDRDGACYLSDAITALDWCLENKDKYGIKIISFSVGGEDPEDGTSILDEACDRMVDEGLVMCVAAGNSGPGPESIVVPGGAEKVITVGAVDESGMIFSKSSRGPGPDGGVKPDLVTNGVDVVSALAGTLDGYSSMSGTSMAVPQVAGSAAVILGAYSDLEPADVKRILLKSADDLGTSGPDNTYGWGSLNLTTALSSVEEKPEKVAGPGIDDVKISRDQGQVGEPVIIEAKASGDVKDLSTMIVGKDRTMEIPMSDFDSNGIYTAWWETSYWKPGDYEIEVNLVGSYGEADSVTKPFRLDPKEE